MSGPIGIGTVGAEQELDLGWMDRTGPWDTRAEPGKYGLTIGDISIGEYGDAPAVSDNLTGRPRGAAARPFETHSQALGEARALAP